MEALTPNISALLPCAKLPMVMMASRMRSGLEAHASSFKRLTNLIKGTNHQLILSGCDLPWNHTHHHKGRLLTSVPDDQMFNFPEYRHTILIVIPLYMSLVSKQATPYFRKGAGSG